MKFGRIKNITEPNSANENQATIIGHYLASKNFHTTVTLNGVIGNAHFTQVIFYHQRLITKQKIALCS